jgi:DNA-binding transcriptional LysR family regulator
VGTALSRETFCVVMPARHRLAQRRGLSLGDLRDEAVIGLPTQSRTRRTLDAAAASAGITLRQTVIVGQFATLMGLVAAGVGVGIVPKGATQSLLARGLRSVPLGEPRLTRRLGLMALREREPTPAAAGFIALLRRRWRQGD